MVYKSVNGHSLLPAIQNILDNCEISKKLGLEIFDFRTMNILNYLNNFFNGKL